MLSIEDLLNEKPGRKKAPSCATQKSSPETSIERQWTLTGLRLVSLVQNCTCGATHTSVQGLYAHEKSGRFLTRTRKASFSHEDWTDPTIPLERETVLETIDVCPDCFSAAQVAREILFSTKANQLELF